MSGFPIILSSIDRRRFLQTASFALSIQASNFGYPEFTTQAASPALPTSANPPLPPSFPAQPPELVHEMVMVSHFDLKRVQQLVDAHPSLARAAWDWGFGDWEDALGAASHMGNRPIAEYLLSQGARPSIFSAAMFGQLEVVKAFIAAQPGLQRTLGPPQHQPSRPCQSRRTNGWTRQRLLASLGDAGSDPQPPLTQTDLDSSSASIHSAPPRTIASTSPPKRTPSPGPAPEPWVALFSIWEIGSSTPVARNSSALLLQPDLKALS